MIKMERKDKYGIDSFMDILDYLFEMNDRGNIKEMLFLVKEAYYFTHGEPESEEFMVVNNPTKVTIMCSVCGYEKKAVE